MGLRKASAERFDKDAAQIARDMGAVTHPRRRLLGTELLLQTKAGPLYVSPSTRPCRGKREGLFTVFCRFEDMDLLKAAPHISDHINPYSGKYNLHVTGHDDGVEYALEAFRQHLTNCGISE